MKHHFYTLCSKEHLYKSLVLYETMKEKEEDFKFYVVCQDRDSFDVLKKLNTIDLIPEYLWDLKDIKRDVLNDNHYEIGMKASTALGLFNKYSLLEHLVWLDCQTGFLSASKPIFDCWDNASILLVEEHDNHSIYSPSIMGFKRDETGLTYLKQLTEGIEAVNQSNSVKIINQQDIFLPGSLSFIEDEKYAEALQWRKKDLYFGNKKLVAFHFDSFRFFDGNVFDLNHSTCKMDDHLIQNIYLPYIEKCKQAVKRIEQVNSEFVRNQPLKDSLINNYFNYSFNSSKAEYNLSTVCSKYKLHQLLALHQSINKYSIKFNLWVCCLDNESYDYLSNRELPEVNLINKQNISAGKGDFKSSYLNYIMKNNYAVQKLLYIEPDYYFFYNPKFIFDRMKKGSIFLFQDKDQTYRQFSNSIIGFQRDQNSLACLRDWCNKPSYSLEAFTGKNNSKGAIDCWPELYQGVRIIRDNGIVLDNGIAKGKRLIAFNNKMFVNKDVLVAYQFNLASLKEANFKALSKQILNTQSSMQKTVYLPYLKTIKSCMKAIKDHSFVDKNL